MDDDKLFGGLSRADEQDAARDFGGLRWDFPADDLNESAVDLFLHLDRLFELLRAPGYMFLNTIELDAEPGRFPEVLLQYFRDDSWDERQTFLRRIDPTHHD